MGCKWRISRALRDISASREADGKETKDVSLLATWSYAKEVRSWRTVKEQDRIPFLRVKTTKYFLRQLSHKPTIVNCPKFELGIT